MNIKYIQKYSKGFSVIELMIAVAILGLLVTVAAPSVSIYIQRSTVNSETQKLAAAFKTARIEALSRTSDIDVLWNSNAGGGANVTLTINGDTLTVQPGDIAVADFSSDIPDDGAAGPGLEVLHNTAYRHERLTLNDDDGDNRIRFNAQGRTTEGGNMVTIGVCKDVGDDDDSMSVQISPMGRITVLDNDNDAGNGNQIAC